MKLFDLSYRCCDSTEEEEDGSCDSDDGASDIKICSSSKEAVANAAGVVPLSSQSSKSQASQKAKSKRPGPPGESFIGRLDINVLLPHKSCHFQFLFVKDKEFFFHYYSIEG